MQLRSDRNYTCTMTVLQGFGEVPYEAFLKDLQEQARRFDNKGDDTDGKKLDLYSCKLDQLGIVSATTTNRQVAAEANLEQFGFKRLISQETKKYETTLSLWGMTVPEFLDALYGDK